MNCNDRNTIIEVYALLDHCNESYITLNQVLVQFRYAISKMRVDAFERNFRGYFGLKPYKGEAQNKRISTRSGSVFVTEELFHVLNSEAFKESLFLRDGYVLLLKKSFILFEENVNSCLKRISNFRKIIEGFGSSLSHCMCIAGYKNFRIASSFVHIPAFQKTLARKKRSESSAFYSPILFSNRDRYFVRLYLQFEEKLQKHIKKAVALFYEAVNRRDKRKKCLLLLLALETCFQASLSNEIAPQHYGRYVYALCNNPAEGYEFLCSNLTVLYDVRENGNLDVFNSLLIDSKMNWLENTLPGVLRRVIRLNHLPQEMLIENLERKFAALTRGRNNF